MEYEDRIRDELVRDDLSSDYLILTKENAVMFDNIDSFVALSRENTSIETLEFIPFDSDPGNYELWDKVGQMVGNLTELKTLSIHFVPYVESESDDDDDDRDTDRIPDWEILTRILPYLRHEVKLFLNYDADAEEIRGLDRAIHGHPMISEFISRGDFTYENFGPWCSTLATLPSLYSVSLGLQEPQTEGQHDLVILEPLTELLRAPALRFVEFDSFYFTNAICHATANALEEGSSILGFEFINDCVFADGGSAIIANALKRNASVTHVDFGGDCDEPLCNSLAAVLLCNSTLEGVALKLPEIACGIWLSSIFLSLGMNTTLKSISVCTFDKFGDELVAAIANGLGKNSTLEELSLYEMVPSDDDGTLSARNALSFLRTNTTLKSLTVSFQPFEEESYVFAFRLEAVKMMQDNHFLESLTIETEYGGIQFEELFALVSALQRDTTLKTFGFQSHESIYLSDDEVKQLVPILTKNYGLEHFVSDISCADDRTIKAIMRLNSAGRRYLIEDGASISKGVDVLSAVNDEIDCVFLHLLENPGLCDRRATETTTRRRAGTTLDESSMYK
jgi:hypothetical protein